MNTTISAFIHVSPDCDINMNVNKRKSNDKKYAALTLDDATIFINDRDKALEIARALEQAAQELEDE